MRCESALWLWLAPASCAQQQLGCTASTAYLARHIQEGSLVLHIQVDSHSSYSIHSPGVARDGRNEQDHADAAPPFSCLPFLPCLLQLVQKVLLLLVMVLTLLLHLAQGLQAHPL
jgi:hypothetical protein